MTSDPGNSATNPAKPPTGSGGAEPLVFGVPAGRLVDALRATGMADSDVVALMGGGIAQSAGVAAAAATPPFVFQTQINQVAPECTLSFQRTFAHPDFIDGVTVVQAEETPEEMGFNKRFHVIESDLDGISVDLHTASNCIAELRLELFGMAQELQAKITEIDTRLDTKTAKETKETKDGKEAKDKESKETKDSKDGKDKEGKDSKDSKDKDSKEHKDGKETKDKEKDGQKDATDLANPFATSSAEPTEGGGGERTFIQLEDRPEVGRAALADPDGDG